MVTKKQDTNYTVSGRITNRQDEPLQGLSVRAFDLDIRTRDNALGQPVITDADGRYKLAFTEKEFKRSKAEKREPALLIRVYDGKAQLGESEVERNAGRGRIR